MALAELLPSASYPASQPEAAFCISLGCCHCDTSRTVSTRLCRLHVEGLHGSRITY